MKMRPDTDPRALDAALAEMRKDDGAPPSDALLARIMGDADAVLAEGPHGDRPRTPAKGTGWRDWLGEVIGGWPTMSGLAAATLAGVWIGVAPPDAVADLSAALFGSVVEVPVFGGDVLAGLEG